MTEKEQTAREAELMYSTEDWYLSDGEAQGFLKYYEGCDYAFAALLPPEGAPLADYIASLGAKTLFARHPPCSVCRKSLAEFCRPQAAKEKSTARFPPRGTAAVAYAANMPPACLLTLRRRKTLCAERASQVPPGTEAQAQRIPFGGKGVSLFRQDQRFPLSRGNLFSRSASAAKGARRKAPLIPPAFGPGAGSP